MIISKTDYDNGHNQTYAYKLIYLHIQSKSFLS